MSERIRRMYEELGIPDAYHPSDEQPAEEFSDGIQLTAEQRLQYSTEELSAIRTLLGRFSEVKASQPKGRHDTGTWAVVIADWGRIGPPIDTPGATSNAIAGTIGILAEQGMEAVQDISQRDGSNL